MPGRGRPWKGVGEGNPDRIGTGAIADGSITEADLDSSVTSKLNSASGHEVLDEGSSLPARARLDFVGDGVVASDGIEDTTTVTIAGGGGSSGFVPDLDTIAFFDEFMYSNPENDTNWFETTRYFLSGTSAIVGQPNIDTGGLIGVETDGTIGRNATLMSGDDDNSSSAKIQFNRDLTMEFAVHVVDVSSTVMLIGGAETPADEGSTIVLAEDGFSQGAYFAFDDNTNANWLCRTQNGGVTSVDSGVSVTNSTYKFKIVYDDGAGTMTYFIDGNQVAQITTTLPDGTCYLACSVNTKIASKGEINIDYWGFTTARLASEP